MTEEKVRKLMIGLLNHIDEHKKGYKKWTNTEIVDTWMKVNNIGHVHELKPIKLKDGEYYDWNGAGKFSIPRCQFLLHRAKAIEDKILDWYKKNYTNCGDYYSVRITNKGKWAVSHSNDYPLQHGKGREVILTEEQFMEATKGGH